MIADAHQSVDALFKASEFALKIRVRVICHVVNIVTPSARINEDFRPAGSNGPDVEYVGSFVIYELIHM